MGNKIKLHNYIMCTVVILFTGCIKETTIDYNTNVKDFQPIVSAAFDEADKIMKEKEEDISDGQHPDADKCICKGTGRIVQGDGHVTDCKYHKKSSEIVGEACPNTLGLEKELKSKNVTIANLTRELDVLNNQISALKEVLYKLNKVEIEIEKKSIEEQTTAVVEAKKPDIRILFFTASWCGPCRQQKGELEKMKGMGYDVGVENTSKVQILDVEKQVEEYNKYRGATESIPLQVVLKDGVVYKRIVGYTLKEKLIEQLNGND